MENKEYDKKVKCDCRDCRRAGPVENFMVTCTMHEYKRSVGTRMCMYFQPKKNVRQDNTKGGRRSR